MSYDKKNKKFISKPVYEGGEKELRAFISKNLKYPKAYIKEQISGTVEINIDINSKGKIIGSKILKSLGKAFDKEAVRVCKLLRFKIPNSGGRSGKVIFHRKLKINFSPPKLIKKNITANVQYQITTSKKGITPADSTEVKKEKKSSYGYTIRF